MAAKHHLTNGRLQYFVFCILSLNIQETLIDVATSSCRSAVHLTSFFMSSHPLSACDEA